MQSLKNLSDNDCGEVFALDVVALKMGDSPAEITHF